MRVERRLPADGFIVRRFLLEDHWGGEAPLLPEPEVGFLTQLSN